MEDLDTIEIVGDALFDHSIKSNRTIEFLKDSRHHLFSAFNEKIVIAMAAGFHYVHPDKDPSLFIDEVGVFEMYQNQGIGSRLVKRIWEHAGGLGCQDARHGTELSNIAAQEYYLKAAVEPSKEPYVIFAVEEGADEQL